MRRILQRLASDERGVAMIVSMGVLAVILSLTAAVAANSVHVSDTSNRDRDEKRAFQAADAGLQVATYRLNKLAPGDGLCVTNVVQAPVNGDCAATGSLGNGATWKYNLSPVLSVGDNCAGFPITSVSQLLPRCITATGTVNGVKRRVQSRIVLNTGAPIFPMPGLIALNSMKFKNSSRIHAGMGANGLVELSNSNEVDGGIKLGPGAPAAQVGNSTIGGGGISYRSNQEGPWVLAPVDVGNSATVNDNGSWTRSGGNTAVWNGGDPAYRELQLDNGTLTLTGGTYNFCQLTVGNSVTIVVPQGAKVRVFIDSPNRPGSGCRSNVDTGRFVVNNGLSILGNADQFQLYVYGGDTSYGPAVEINNSGDLHMGIHAPSASVLFKNSQRFWGGINAKNIEWKNSTDFWWDDSLSSLRGVTTSLYQRTAWRECQPDPTSSAAASGC